MLTNTQTASSARAALELLLEHTADAPPPAAYGASQRMRAAQFKDTAARLIARATEAAEYRGLMLADALESAGFAERGGCLYDSAARDRIEVRRALIAALRSYTAAAYEASRCAARRSERIAAADPRAPDPGALAEAARARAVEQFETSANAWAERLAEAMQAADWSTVRATLESAEALAARARALNIDPGEYGLV